MGPIDLVHQPSQYLVIIVNQKHGLLFIVVVLRSFVCFCFFLCVPGYIDVTGHQTLFTSSCELYHEGAWY